MIIVLAVAGVDVEGPFSRVILQIRLDRRLVPAHHVFVLAAQHVDVAGHMHQMARIRHQRAQNIASLQCFFGEGRHFHEMDVKMQQTGMRHAARQAHMTLQQGAGFGGCRAAGNLAGRQIPHRPGREVHQRVHEKRCTIRVIRVGVGHIAHRIGKGVVPGCHILDRGTLRIAGGEGGDQGSFCSSGVIHDGEGRLSGVKRFSQRLRAAFGIVKHPRHVVVRTRRVSVAPMGHRAGRISGGGALETGDGFLVVKPVEPVEPAVEPQLRRRVCGGHPAGIGPKIIGIVHRALLALTRSGGINP